MWHKIITVKDKSLFLNTLKNSHSVYQNETAEGMNSVLNRDGAENWIFQRLEDDFKIVFSIYKKRTGPREARKARILIAIPSGNYTLQDLPFIAKQLIRKTREYLDRNNLEFFEAKTLDDYKNQRLNTLYQITIPEIMHEHESGIIKSKSKQLKMEFRRRTEDKIDDENFEKRRIR